MTSQPKRTNNDDKPDFKDRNYHLAKQRIAVKAELAELSKVPADERTSEQRRAYAKAARELDRVTAEMVELNYGLVRKYVRLFTSRSPRRDVEEFEQAGVLGLISAIDTFNPDEGKLGPWAWRRIVRETLQAVHAVDHPNINMTDFEVQGKIRKAKDRWELLHPEAEVDRRWLADETGATIEQVGRVLDKHSLVSTDLPLGDEGGSTLGDMIVDPNSDVADEVITKISQEALERHALPLLTPQELFVLMRRRGLDAEPEMNLVEIGDMLGLSREAIRQADLRAVAKIRHPRVLKACLRAMAS